MLMENPIPTKGFYDPILQVLREMGGSGSPDEVVKRVGQILKDDLKESDWEALETKPVRWINRCHRARIGLIAAGEMRGDSPVGLWEIYRVT